MKHPYQMRCVSLVTFARVEEKPMNATEYPGVPQKARLLLIDDSPDDLRLLTELAKSNGWSVSVARDGREGLNKARLTPFDLILLDVRMPGMDGFAVCRLLKADSFCRTIPVIFLSSAGDQESRIAGLLLGAEDFIVKSYANASEIVIRIAIQLRRNHASSSLPTPPPVETERTPGAKLRRAAERLLMNAADHPVPMAEVAKMTGTSEKKLNEVFLAAHGQSAAGWYREQRMRIAIDLLETSDIPIGDIAEHLGYSTGQNFATAFRERFGRTPSEIRADAGRRKGADDSP